MLEHICAVTVLAAPGVVRPCLRPPHDDTLHRTRYLGDERTWQDGQRELLPCTGLTATWCPVHGDCTCPRMPWFLDFESMDSPACPLHSVISTHPIYTEPEN